MFDVVVAATALVVLWPVVAVVAVLVRLRLGSPVLFRQRRLGRMGRPFELVKFRTMTDARGPDGSLLPDAERLTGLGRVLRRTSLDELPELVNVLRGEMSLVGPRPLPERYLERYSPEERRRHLVRPGITGWAQVQGRNALDWNERLAADVWYVDNRSFRLDLKILARTVAVVLHGGGVSAPDHATMAELTPHEQRRATRMEP
ncbi:sugar transferase [Rhabdothermincola salaria]|uniref:sugar transferase n=1 Tax=Rhabdothermincola salaria TaxID=2903142 RepID=UPI001E46236F|nr:sugar transferase [Rhabdothermincola salaria]MCD9622748.1 sugar transferase [Rhabdothermincola salaria]